MPADAMLAVVVVRGGLQVLFGIIECKASIGNIVSCLWYDCVISQSTAYESCKILLSLSLVKVKGIPACRGPETI